MQEQEQETKFRAGMWVVDLTGRVGICYAFHSADGSIGQEVHPVNAKGESLMRLDEKLGRMVTASEPWDGNAWKQAAHADIPEPRRPSVEIAMKYGYKVEG